MFHRLKPVTCHANAWDCKQAVGDVQSSGEGHSQLTELADVMTRGPIYERVVATKEVNDALIADPTVSRYTPTSMLNPQELVRHDKDLYCPHPTSHQYNPRCGGAQHDECQWWQC